MSIDVIKNFLEAAPNSPGVYRMIDKNSQVLYVGKAKNLNKRLAQYTQLSRLPERIQSVVAATEKIEVITTRTEAEALLLEADLIKNLHPRYNIILRDSKSYPYILIREDHEFNQILKYRGNKETKGKYFGPFASVKDLDNSLAVIQKIFKLRSCSDNYFASRKRPCILYQIKRCSAPCVAKISKEQYQESVKEAYSFLSGKTSALQVKLKDFMEEASNNMQYELAALYRDRIKSLTAIQAGNIFFNMPFKNVDIIAIRQELGECCVQVFFIRNGYSYGNKPFFPINTEGMALTEIITAFITQLYSYHTPPSKIILNIAIENKEIVEQALAIKAKHRVSIIDKTTANIRAIVKFAEENAAESLKQKLSSLIKQHRLLVELQELFDLTYVPKRVEAYDNSHIMGKQAVGVMIAVKERGFDKSSYRKFNINLPESNPTGGNDYAMLEEVLTRRFVRLKKDHPEYMPGIWPDLILIDGGAGHLKIALRVLANLQLTAIKVVCIAKGPERVIGEERLFTQNNPPFTLDKDSPVFRYIQIMRDEAHNYAIRSHRKKRSQSLSKSLLDNIPNIGKTRKKALLSHFGSIQAIKEAEINEIARIKLIGKNIAKIVYDYLHNLK